MFTILILDPIKQGCGINGDIDNFGNLFEKIVREILATPSVSGNTFLKKLI